MIRVPPANLPLGILARQARAQEAPGAVGCEVAGNCPEVYLWGAWGMIAIGITFFLVGFLPARRKPEEDSAGWLGVQMMKPLQRRIEREQTGWRRMQWLILGVFFILLGGAYLVGWQ
ncbi:MAG: hypothetical protein ACE5KF_04620 [Kiloniellaceae bacterium]